MRAILMAAVAVSLCLKGEVLPIRSYTTSDGLAADRIDCIVPDSRGFIWFCTPEGLTRFDGYRMVSFGASDGLPSGAVDSFLETRSGAYLVGTDRGLSQLHASAAGGTFVNPRQASDGFDKPIYLLRQSRSGRIWCGTRGALFELSEGGTFRRQPLQGLKPKFVTDVLEDAGGKLWVATDDGIIVLRKDGAAQRLTKQDGLPNDWVNALLLDRSGRLWAGARDGLVLLRDGGPAGPCGVQRVYTNKDGLAGRNVMALAEGPDGTIWMGTPVGITRLPAGSVPRFQNLTRAQGLSDRQIIALASDTAGNMWAGTEGAGVMRIASAGFITFREQDGLMTDRVFSVFADRAGQVVTVTEMGALRRRSVAVFDGGQFHAVVPQVYGDKPGWGWNQIVLQSRAGDWWAATKVGLCRFAATSAVGLAQRQPRACYARDADVFRVFEDSRGGIWASGQSQWGDRLMRWDPATDAISSFDDEAKPLVSAFAEDRSGVIWMGYWGGGLLRYENGRFTRIKAGDGAPAGAIFALLADSAGRLWIGSGSDGLGLVENPSQGPFHPRTYNTMKGLASNKVMAIVEDRAGRIYAGTGKGVDRLEPVTGRIKHFSSADGLPYGEIKSAFRDRSGDLWFATTQGLSRLTPTADRSPGIPSVLVTDLETGGRRYPVSQAGEALLRPPKLDPSRNQLQVTFVGFNDEPAESLVYRYMLEGTDKTWHDTREHAVNYAALEPGGYRFLVKALNSEDKASGVPAEIDFEVLPPFWRRWWFETLALAGLASLVWAAHRYRVAQAVHLERVRTRIATDLHDDIGASLSQIAILSEVLIQRCGHDQGLSGPLDGMARSARELLASMSDIVWAINPRHDHLWDLQQRMRRFASDLLAARNIELVFSAPAADRDLKLGADMRREVFLVFKEAVNNIVRHAQCTQAEVDFSRDRDWLALRISDNGKGLPACESGAGHGLVNMRSRARTLGGEVNIDSAAGCGTTIDLRIPLVRPRVFPWRSLSK
jgi:ligand-binding sensor domain-containing protein/signal transduction histidine kinase